MEGQKVIIKKKRKKQDGHGGGHGGSWKVAYADFVTAMMAFFLLMWLLSMTTTKQKNELANYFKNFNLFDAKGTTFLDTSGSQGAHFKVIPGDATKTNDNEEARSDEEEAENVTNKTIKELMPKDKKGGDKEASSNEKKEQLKEQLKKDIEAKLGGIKEQVIVEVTDKGVLIRIVDNEKNEMFPLGSADLTSKGAEVIKVIASNLRRFNGKFIIEGHTDARSYPSRYYTNWELSTDRASAARRIMEQYGFPIERLIRVSGYADTEPLFKDNPYDPRNRRITILCITDKKIISEESSH